MLSLWSHFTSVHSICDSIFVLSLSFLSTHYTSLAQVQQPAGRHLSLRHYSITTPACTSPTPKQPPTASPPRRVTVQQHRTRRRRRRTKRRRILREQTLVARLIRLAGYCATCTTLRLRLRLSLSDSAPTHSFLFATLQQITS